MSHHLRCSATSTEPVAAPPKPPERVPIGDTARVAAALAAGGAVILTDLGPIDDWEQTATTLPARVFPQPGKLISTEPVVAGIHRENRRFTELRKERQRAMHAVSPMEQRAIGLNGDEDEPAWGGLGGLTHENNAAAGEDEGGGEAPDINEGGVGGSMLPHTDGCESRDCATRVPTALGFLGIGPRFLLILGALPVDPNRTGPQIYTASSTPTCSSC